MGSKANAEVDGMICPTGSPSRADITGATCLPPSHGVPHTPPYSNDYGVIEKQTAPLHHYAATTNDGNGYDL